MTDSHVPPAIARAARKLAPLEIIPLREWHGGIYLHETDPKILAQAWEERLTIVTYDVSTFPLHIKERLEGGPPHAGVVYVSGRYRQNSIGRIARGIVWTNRVQFLGE